jgi:hypothetical protein
METKIICDNCKKELVHIFAGDEFEGQFLCTDCLKKSDYHIYHSLKIIKTIEQYFDSDYHFQFTEGRSTISDIQLYCGICKESWRITESEIETKVKSHFQLHKNKMLEA